MGGGGFTAPPSAGNPGPGAAGGGPPPRVPPSGQQQNPLQQALVGGGAANGNGPLPGGVAQQFQNLGQTANAVGSASALAVPGAAQFQQGLYNPGFNQMQMGFLQNAGALQQDQIQRTFSNTLAGQYAGLPGVHSSELQLQADTARHAGQDLLNSAQPIYEQNQQLAAQNLPNVLASPIAAAGAAANASGSAAQLGQSMYNNPYQLAQGYLNGSPFVPPSILAQPVQAGANGAKK